MGLDLCSTLPTKAPVGTVYTFPLNQSLPSFSLLGKVLGFHPGVGLGERTGNCHLVMKRKLISEE